MISPIATVLSVSVCMRLSVRLCVTVVSIDRAWAKIKIVKLTFVDFNICHRMASLRKLYSVTLKIKDSNWDLPNSGERPFKCDECEYCCTQSCTLARHKLIHSSKRPFKCDECEFECDEGDISSKTNRQVTRHKRVRHLKIVLPDSVPFV